jgi:hypothetical protein
MLYSGCEMEGREWRVGRDAKIGIWNESAMMRGLVLIIAAGLLVLALLACGLPSPAPEPTATVFVPAVMSPTEEPTPLSTGPPLTLAPTEPVPTASPVPAICPAPGSPVLIQPANFADYPAAIQRFLSAGGDVATLESTLADWDALPDSHDQAIAIDLKGDGNMEVVVALADPNAEMFARPGDLLIFSCQAGTYVLQYQEGYDAYGPAIRMLQVGDANLDGQPDVVYTLSVCGAHTCYETLEIRGWNGMGFASLMGGVLEMPYPTYIVTHCRIEAQSGGIGSVGAEPQRGYSEVWEWNGNVYTITEQIWEPPVYRYHALLDGDRALLSQDYATALAAYERVISDDTLKEFAGTVSTVSAGDERAQLAAFARWRLLLAFLLMGELDSAQLEYNRLQVDYPAGSVGYEVAAMARTFWMAYLADSCIADGCAEVVAAAEEDASVQDFFNSNYGYANPWWEPMHLCPFIEQEGP